MHSQRTLLRSSVPFPFLSLLFFFLPSFSIFFFIFYPFSCFFSVPLNLFRSRSSIRPGRRDSTRSVSRVAYRDHRRVVRFMKRRTRSAIRPVEPGEGKRDEEARRSNA